ncbi:hypothetical protein GGX14DRAFT_675259 [Mycena pura]|uniref:Cytochrome P450 n=1 Tax=Mycena pura TaxID=153505 RepID=A0AAD6VUJ7_9AGAR|nr:hypothetical protein GGX14DRAFT_675259 [Mycena pura]
MVDAPEVEYQLIHALAPGAALPFELLSVHKYFPLPLAPWRTVGRQIEAVRTSIHRQLSKAVQCLQVAGDEESREYTGLVLLDASSDTTGAFLHSFTGARASGISRVSERARKIDSVVENARLPILEDVAQMPYLDALRDPAIQTQFPIGVSHSVSGGVVVQESPRSEVRHARAQHLCVRSTIQFSGPSPYRQRVALETDYSMILKSPGIFDPDRFLDSTERARKWTPTFGTPFL